MKIGNPEDNRFAVKIAIRAVTVPKLAMILIAANTVITEQMIAVIVTSDVTLIPVPV